MSQSETEDKDFSKIRSSLRVSAFIFLVKRDNNLKFTFIILLPYFRQKKYIFYFSNRWK